MAKSRLGAMAPRLRRLQLDFRNVLPPPTSDHLEWRREWDSNPRTLAGLRFSRPVQSTTLPSLRIEQRQQCHGSTDWQIVLEDRQNADGIDRRLKPPSGTRLRPEGAGMRPRTRG